MIHRCLVGIQDQTDGSDTKCGRNFNCKPRIKRV